MLTFSLKTGLLALLVGVVLVASGCTGTTPIQSLALPPVSTIEGTITGLTKNSFILTDPSGSILVRVNMPNGGALPLAVDERVKVFGNLLAGEEKIFDGYVIRKSTGEQIIVSDPSPHFGLVIQSSFR